MKLTKCIIVFINISLLVFPLIFFGALIYTSSPTPQVEISRKTMSSYQMPWLKQAILDFYDYMVNKEYIIYIYY